VIQNKDGEQNSEKGRPILMRDRFIKTFNEVAVKVHGFPVELAITQGLEYDDSNEEVVFRATLHNRRTNKTVVVQLADYRFWWKGINDTEIVEVVVDHLRMREERARMMLGKAGLI
jgi:hypothetical protein